MKIRLVLVLLCCMVLMSGSMVSAQREEVPPWRAQLPQARSTAEIVVGETPLTVELAITSAESALGLGYRNELEPGRGMLFIFPEPSELTFWMKGMRFCLDIIWVLDGEIIGAAENACPDPEGTEDADRLRYPSPALANYVLEVPAGWLAENGYGPGTQIELPDGL
jgi:uncharacterized membrane protein (UPF0127 family)